MRIHPVETFAAGVEPHQFALMDEVLARADTGCFTLVGKAVSPWPGKEVVARVAAAVRALGGIRITEMLVARSWLSANARNLLVVKFELNSRVAGIIRDCCATQQAFGCWQDPALFRQGKLLLWSCTHEGDAVVFGSYEWLQSHGLSPRRADPIDVIVENLDPDTSVQIVRMSMES